MGREGLKLEVAGSYPVIFRSGFSSTGPTDGRHNYGMGIDTWHSWNGEQMFSGGVMAYEDVLKLQAYINDWLERRKLEVK